MSYLAASICLHMETFPAFKALSALMSTNLLFDMFRLQERRVSEYLPQLARFIVKPSIVIFLLDISLPQRL